MRGSQLEHNRKVETVRFLEDCSRPEVGDANLRMKEFGELTIESSDKRDSDFWCKCRHVESRHFEMV
jgi:hypothetical protein